MNTFASYRDVDWHEMAKQVRVSRLDSGIILVFVGMTN